MPTKKQLKYWESMRGKKRGSKQKVRKVCPNCNKEFISYISENKKYCSKKCYTNSGRQKYICIVCGKEFIKKKYYKGKSVRYCSRRCFVKDIKNNKSYVNYWKLMKGKSIKNSGQFKKRDKPWNKMDRENPIIECACGCGGKLRKYDNKWRERKLLLGHHPKYNGSYTSIEKKVYEELKKRGLLFETQKAVGNRFIVDAYIPKFNLVVEADGNYWHSLPKVKKRDKVKNAYLEEHGYNLLRLTGTEIRNGQFKKKIMEVIQ